MKKTDYSLIRAEKHVRKEPPFIVQLLLGVLMSAGFMALLWLPALL